MKCEQHNKLKDFWIHFNNKSADRRHFVPHRNCWNILANWNICNSDTTSYMIEENLNELQKSSYLVALCHIHHNSYESLVKKWLRLKKSTLKVKYGSMAANVWLKKANANAIETVNYRTLQWYSCCGGWRRLSGADVLWWQVSEAQQRKRWRADWDSWLTKSAWHQQAQSINY